MDEKIQKRDFLKFHLNSFQGTFHWKKLILNNFPRKNAFPLNFLTENLKKYKNSPGKKDIQTWIWNIFFAPFSQEEKKIQLIFPEKT